MFKVKRDYGNGFQVEVEDAKVTGIVAKLAAADELFLDVRCAAQIDGQVQVSEKIKFNVRSSTTKEGKPCKYYEQICVDTSKPALKWYKRQMGVYQDSEIGGLFVKTRADDEPNTTPGLNGWSKYNGTGQQGGGYASNSYSAPQRESAPPPPRREPERQPAASSVSYDDIPF